MIFEINVKELLDFDGKGQEKFIFFEGENIGLELVQ